LFIISPEVRKSSQGFISESGKKAVPKKVFWKNVSITRHKPTIKPVSEFGANRQKDAISLSPHRAGRNSEFSSNHHKQLTSNFQAERNSETSPTHHGFDPSGTYNDGNIKKYISHLASRMSTRRGRSGLPVGQPYENFKIPILFWCRNLLPQCFIVVNSSNIVINRCSSSRASLQ
jgi:hypothetical protein